MPAIASPELRPQSPRMRRRRGMTLIEVLIALGAAGLLFTMITAQLIESGRISVRITETLDHSRNAREVIDSLSADVRASQILRIFPSFTDRSAEARDGQFGNYLVLQTVVSPGTITRTIGYYLVALEDGSGWELYRHDSAAGDSASNALPGAETLGTHRKIKRAVTLPNAGQLFRCTRDRGVSIHGEFSTPETAGSDRTEFIRCTVSTRS